MPSKFTIGLINLVAWVSLTVAAQTLPEYSMRGADQAADLKLPAEPTSISEVLEPRMALYKPEGNGPFPALVLLHQCGGLATRLGPNASMLDWVKEGVARGYVVLLLDSFGQRGVDTVCFGPKGNVFQSRGVKDALQAAAHVRALPFVDRKRVVFAGFSWGAGNGLLLSSGKAASAVGSSDRFDAAVSFYPPCNNHPKGGNPPPYTLILSGIDRPLLVLLAGKDTETPPAECIAGLQSNKASGTLVEWHLYPEATHCWDCKQLHGLKKIDIRGSNVEYLYDESVTRDSANRMFGFFEKSFGRRP